MGQKLRLEAAKIRDQSATAREVSRLLGKFNSVARGVPPSPFCRAIQRDLAKALEKSNQSYNAPCQLSPASKEELDWWTHQLARWNGKSLVMTAARPPYRIRCLPHRVGSVLQGDIHGRPVVHKGTLRRKSSQSYDSLCIKWISWCSERQADPVSGPTEDVVNFLAFLHGEGWVINTRH